jgi:radical SAM protein with 4Fe4S-binding SPASM domain
MLRELGVKGVQVSIEGPEAVHDVIRGRGSFNASIEGIKKLLDAGLRVTMNVTLSKLNAVHMAEMVSLARSFGVQRLGFSRLVPAGRGLALLHKMLPAEEVKRLYESLLTHNLEDLEIVTGDPVAASQTLLSHDEGGCTALGGCAAGVSGLTILSDGTLTPCRRLHIPIGNVRIDSMREVWATSEVLDALRDKTRYKGRCGSCPRWADCRGCRAIAYAVAKEKGVEDPFLHEDPQCFHPH